MTTKISVITAVYNRRATVAQALTSVQQQSYVDVEHVVVDGASTDGSLQAIRDGATANTVLCSEPDRGIYDALNKGIKLCSGDVIGLMHSDDYYADESVLEDVAAAFADPMIDAVYGDLDYVDSADTTRVIRRWRAGVYHRDLLDWGWMPPHPTLYVRRRVIDRLGAYDTRYQISADYDCILRYFGEGRIRSTYLPRVLVKMRLGGASNESLKKIARKSWEDWLAMRRNGIGSIGGVGALAWKNLSKLQQFAVLTRPIPRV
jgi:glycosyltransferase involved in cell wall biosynthesis